MIMDEDHDSITTYAEDICYDEYTNTDNDIFRELELKYQLLPKNVRISSRFPEYLVSDDGRIFHMKYQWISDDSQLHQVKVLYKKHAYVFLKNRQNAYQRVRLDRLVAENFLPNFQNHPDVKQIVGHKDGDAVNCHVDNLYWRNYPSQLERGAKTILSREQAVEIFKRLMTNETVRSIGKDFGVSYQAIQLIRDGEMWRNAAERQTLLDINGYVESGLAEDVIEMILRRTGDQRARRVSPHIHFTDGYYVTENGNLFRPIPVNEKHRKRFNLDTATIRFEWISPKTLIVEDDRSKKKLHPLEKIILYTFAGPPREKPFYIHFKDENPENITLNNLEYLYKRKYKRQKDVGVKLNDTQVKEIRKRLERGERKQKLAQEYGATYLTIHKIGNRTSWKELQ